MIETLGRAALIETFSIFLSLGPWGEALCGVCLCLCIFYDTQSSIAAPSESLVML